MDCCVNLCLFDWRVVIGKLGDDVVCGIELVVCCDLYVIGWVCVWYGWGLLCIWLGVCVCYDFYIFVFCCIVVVN